MSDKIDKWVKDRPDSWVKDVPEGQTTLEDFKNAFKKEMRKAGKSYVLKYLKETQWEQLWGAQQVKQGVEENREMKKELKELKKEGYSEAEAFNRLVNEFIRKEYKAKTYKRRGKEISGYSAYHIDWNQAQERWLKSRLSEVSNKKLTQNFNAYFGTDRQVSSVRDKKYRLLGKKK